ncbi:uncharacterized protein LOC110456602 [Mizuhopecten yessoensis]|uniref:uncharacterized protein LOC110456602 n=1 Tax=Mizuhopecten yessoensis TaxID=6573 RepID=UPI000B45E91B|nr:uncharacterized protein LOC110456602 [Mizuhopecten yessoensis]
MTWVKSGYCPNYFVISNNMFKKKVYGQNQRKLLRILDQCHQLKWMCLSVGTCFNPSIMEYLSYSGVQAELERPQTQQKLEHDNDMEILDGLKWCRRLFLYRNTIISPVALLLKSQSEVDELITYYSTVCTLSTLATGVYPDCSVPIGNKARYKSMTKCKHWLIPGSLFGTEVLYLATFHFKTGNYRKAIQICNGVMLLKTFGIDDETRVPPERQASHVHAYCGQGYSSIDKLKKIFTYHLFFKDNPFCLSQFQPELSKCSRGLYIPSLPYAVFLCFLCCHELGDIRGREAVLRRLIMVKYDELQGGHKHWIVHTLLGICYETLGDNHRAITAYLESYQTKTLFHELNPAMERIEALRSNSG